MMNFAFTEEQERFRQEVTDFCKQEMRQGVTRETVRSFRQKVSERCWPGLSIPQEYGGLGMGAVYRVIFMEETAYQRAPIVHYDHGVTLSLLGNMLLRHGTEAQKRRYLPLIASGEIHCGQGYSEPEAGNDIANVQTKAVRDGDHYVVNGQKMWVHDARVYKYSLLMARTDPRSVREKGLSLFLLDNKSPGVTVIPQLAMNGQLSPQVFLDNVVIPAENLVGEEGRGWDYYLELKPFYWNKEQGAETGMMRRLFDDIVRYVKQTTRRGRPLSQDGLVRQKLAELTADITALRHLVYRMAWLEDRGLDLFDISAKMRVFHVETWVKLTGVITTLLGKEGQIDLGSPDAALGGMMSRLYPAAALQLMQRAGPSYIKSIIATDILGMPKPW
jgi:alkylation response protein AidB-like acyl-CoA dehydrogenase